MQKIFSTLNGVKLSEAELDIAQWIPHGTKKRLVQTVAKTSTSLSPKEYCYLLTYDKEVIDQLFPDNQGNYRTYIHYEENLHLTKSGVEYLYYIKEALPYFYDVSDHENALDKCKLMEQVTRLAMIKTSCQAIFFDGNHANLISHFKITTIVDGHNIDEFYNFIFDSIGYLADESKENIFGIEIANDRVLMELEMALLLNIRQHVVVSNEMRQHSLNVCHHITLEDFKMLEQHPELHENILKSATEVDVPDESSA